MTWVIHPPAAASPSNSVTVVLARHLQALKSQAVDSSTAGRELAGAGAEGLRYQDYTHHTPSSHVGEQPAVVSGQTQFGGQNFSGTHASMQWGIKDIPTPKEMVAALNDWVVGQGPAKKVGEYCNSRPYAKASLNVLLSAAATARVEKH